MQQSISKNPEMALKDSQPEIIDKKQSNVYRTNDIGFRRKITNIRPPEIKGYQWYDPSTIELIYSDASGGIPPYFYSYNLNGITWDNFKMINKILYLRNLIASIPYIISIKTTDSNGNFVTSSPVTIPPYQKNSLNDGIKVTDGESSKVTILTKQSEYSKFKENRFHQQKASPIVPPKAEAQWFETPVTTLIVGFTDATGGSGQFLYTFNINGSIWDNVNFERNIPANIAYINGLNNTISNIFSITATDSTGDSATTHWISVPPYQKNSLVTQINLKEENDMLENICPKQSEVNKIDKKSFWRINASIIPPQIPEGGANYLLPDYKYLLLTFNPASGGSGEFTYTYQVNGAEWLDAYPGKNYQTLIGNLDQTIVNIITVTATDSNGNSATSNWVSILPRQENYLHSETNIQKEENSKVATLVNQPETSKLSRNTFWQKKQGITPPKIGGVVWVNELPHTVAVAAYPASGGTGDFKYVFNVNGSPWEYAQAILPSGAFLRDLNNTIVNIFTVTAIDSSGNSATSDPVALPPRNENSLNIRNSIF